MCSSDLLERNNKSVILSAASDPRSGPLAESKDPAPNGTPNGPSGNSHDAPAAPRLDLTAIARAIDNFEVAGKRLDDSLGKKLASGLVDPKQAATLNHGMMQLERNWLNPDGIPGRPWFKHILYGARFTYAHLELPGLTEAVEAQDWPTAKQQAEILQRALEKNTALVNELNATLSK